MVTVPRPVAVTVPMPCAAVVMVGAGLVASGVVLVGLALGGVGAAGVGGVTVATVRRVLDGPGPVVRTLRAVLRRAGDGGGSPDRFDVPSPGDEYHRDRRARYVGLRCRAVRSWRRDGGHGRGGGRGASREGRGG